MLNAYAADLYMCVTENDSCIRMERFVQHHLVEPIDMAVMNTLFWKTHIIGGMDLYKTLS